MKIKEGKTKPPVEQKVPETQEDFIPQDGGAQAWLVMICSFIINGVFYGVVDSYGVLFVPLREHFEDIPNAATQVSLGNNA